MSGIQDLYRLAEVTTGKPATMMVFPVGEWSSAKYPRLSLTQELADEIIANFETDVLRTRVPIDENHDPKSPANGWVERLYMAPYEWGGLSGEALYADWTPNERGAQAVNGGEFSYDSPEIGSHTDPVTAVKHANVLKAISLTNRPVLRMMPSISDAPSSLRLSEPVEIALAEVTAAPGKGRHSDTPTDGGETTDPVQELLDDLESLASKLDERLKGKKGMPSARAFLREVRGKVAAYRLSDSSDSEDGGLAAPGAVSEPVSPAAKGDEGNGSALSEADSHTKGPTMDPKTLQALKLAEGADDAAVAAAVLALSERVEAGDAAVLELAEVKKTARSAAVDAKLAELITGGHVAPGQKDTWLALAEASPAQFDAMAEAAKAHKIIELGEHGAQPSASEEKSYDDPTVELAERADALLKAGKAADIVAAQDMVLAEDQSLKDRLFAPPITEER